MKASVPRVALLVLGSGFCALVYQVAWLRLFRLVFGASTAASAAVLAIFMGGLGAGSILLGRRADAHRRPLAFYGRLEAGIALAAAVSPLLILLVQRLYVGLGGTLRLGTALGTPVRLLLSALVLAVPTFLMGGTLPAVARAVERSADRGRRYLAALYGANTLGAVAGALWTTFVALEALGTRRSVWAACAVNLLVALAALRWAGPEREVEPAPAEPVAPEAEPAAPGAPVPFVLAASALVGFAFFLMELVWYRMLSPLLGGSSYTFGLILAVALLGIGAGGLLYAAGATARRPTLLGFAATCALEACLLLVPFALGDRIAMTALLLRPLGSIGFAPLVAVWSAVAALVVLPPALVAGYQFPLLVGLLGSGERQVGRQVGLAYAANTLGAIAGSLAGGFGLIPLLTAPGVWRLAALLLAALAVFGLLLGLRRGLPGRLALAPAAAGVAALLLATAAGPTAAWRHTPIGAGRVQSSYRDANDLRNMMHGQRHAMVWEADGVESSVAVKASNELHFLINGKADGSARGDAPTQVMSGLLGAILHPAPRRALVIGLGTGSSAGWLAAVPSIERVDVVEIEPAIARVARFFDPVNHQALANPRIRLHVADGRELLLTARDTYDVIFSEPSNPYRSGISSLFTREFYQAVAGRMAPGGIFLQWLQGYDVDARVVRTAYATMGTVFPAIETWQVNSNDLLLAGTREPIAHDARRIAARVAEEPFASALRWTWGVEGLAGFYSGFVAAPPFARAFATEERGALNTDDHPVIEFGFVRNLGRTGLFDVHQLRQLAAAQGLGRPAGLTGVDWARVAELDAARNASWDTPAELPGPADPATQARVRARQAYSRGDLAEARRRWLSQPAGPLGPFDLSLAAEVLADAGDPRAAAYARALRRKSPSEAEAVLARLALRQGRVEEAVRHLEAAFRAARVDPWPYRRLLGRGIDLAVLIGQREPPLARRLFAALDKPFVVGILEDQRLRARFELSILDPRRLCVPAFADFEPHVPWEERFLALRLACYRQAGHPLRARAEEDFEDYLAATPPRLEAWLGAPPR